MIIKQQYFVKNLSGEFFLQSLRFDFEIVTGKMFVL